MIAPRCAISVGSSSARERHQRGDVGVDHRAPVVELRALRGQRALREAGVVDQQVDGAETVRQRVQRGAHRSFVADVESGDVQPLALQIIGERPQTFLAPTGGDDAPAGGDEAARRRQAEAGGRAGDERGAQRWAVMI